MERRTENEILTSQRLDGIIANERLVAEQKAQGGSDSYREFKRIATRLRRATTGDMVNGVHC